MVRRRWKPLAAPLRADINLVLAANRVAILNARIARCAAGPHTRDFPAAWISGLCTWLRV